MGDAAQSYQLLICPGMIFLIDNSHFICKNLKTLSQALSLSLSLGRKIKSGKRLNKENIPLCIPIWSACNTNTTQEVGDNSSWCGCGSIQPSRNLSDLNANSFNFLSSFTKVELKEILPGISKWKIDQARLHAAIVGHGLPTISHPIHRTRLDPSKTDHFLDFISKPCFLQDVAYGTRKLKLDSGEQIMIPNVIRTAIPSWIVKKYLAFCSKSGFKPVGERTPFRILEVCQVSQQKSLQGLNYVSTEGSEVFDTLEDVVET